MAILNPLTGENVSLSNIVNLAEERAKRQKDTTATPSSGCVFRDLDIPKPVALLDKDWDEGADQYVTTVTTEEHFQRQRLLNRYLAEKAEQGDDL